VAERAAERRRRKQRAAELRALRVASDQAEAEMIRRRLAMTPEQRLDFLRVKLPGGGSAL
jgi:hypothetical protein